MKEKCNRRSKELRAEEKTMKEEAKGEGCTGNYFVEKMEDA